MPEQQFSTSFIPKKAPEARALKTTGRSLLLVVSVLILIVVLLSAVGVFLYERLLVGSIEGKRATLQRAEDAFEPALIEELLALDTRLTHATGLLDSHRMPSAIFELLENTTLEGVRFTDFSYSAIGNEISLSLEGEATSFATVALQSDVYGETDAIKDPLIDNLSVNVSGNVSFTLDAMLDPSLLTYAAGASFDEPSDGGGVSVPPSDSGTDINDDTIPEEPAAPSGFEEEPIDNLPEL